MPALFQLENRPMDAQINGRFQRKVESAKLRFSFIVLKLSNLLKKKKNLPLISSFWLKLQANLA